MVYRPVTDTGDDVKEPGELPRLIAVAVLVATVPFGVEPFGKRTLMSRSPELPAGSELISKNCTLVRPVPIKLLVTLMAAMFPLGEAGTVDMY